MSDLVQTAIATVAALVVGSLLFWLWRRNYERRQKDSQ
jgi:hypothetical protein